MNKSSGDLLPDLLVSLTTAARRYGLNDSAWAAAAGVSKETLSRLRKRRSCDLSTLDALARAAGVTLSVCVPAAPPTDTARFPSEITREYEQHLLELCARTPHERDKWAAAGPLFFMAGLAVMLASMRGSDRQKMLLLGESLHHGASEVSVFSEWLRGSPLRPSRFLPMLVVESMYAT